MANRSLLKSYFQTKDKPTQGQFAALIDSLFHPGEDELDITKVAGLLNALAQKADQSAIDALKRTITINYGTGSMVLPAGIVTDKIIVAAPSTAIVKVGTTFGGEEIVATQEITGDLTFPYSWKINANTTIYINGLLADTKIYIFKDKI